MKRQICRFTRSTAQCCRTENELQKSCRRTARSRIFTTRSRSSGVFLFTKNARAAEHVRTTVLCKMGNTQKKERYNRNSSSFTSSSSTGLSSSSSTITNNTTTVSTTSNATTTTATSPRTESTPSPVTPTASTTTTQPTTTPTTPTKSSPTTKPSKEDKPKEEKSKKLPVKEGPDDFQYSLVIIGESGVGKTSLLSRFTDRKFNASVQPTQGIDFDKQSVMVEQKKVGLEIWDTAGDERTRVPTTFYQDCLGVLAVYDVGDLESFENIDKWVSDAEKFAKRAEVKWLIGNKSDRTRAVTTEQAKEYAKSKGMVFYEVSAKSSDNVDDLFQNIGTVIKKQFNK